MATGSRHAATNRTRVPGVSRAGGSAVDVEQVSVGAADEPPAAGRRGRVDAGVRAGQRDRAGRHPGPRAWPAGARPARRAARSGRRSRARSRRTRPGTRCRSSRSHHRRHGRRPSARATPAGPARRRRPGPSTVVGSARRRRRGGGGPARATASAAAAGSGSAVEQHGPGAGHDLDGGQLARRRGGATARRTRPRPAGSSTVEQQGVRPDGPDPHPLILADVVPITGHGRCRASRNATTCK